MNSSVCPGTASVAVVGAGIAATALAAGLRRGGWQGAITLLEAGRGPGGRSASRRSRHDPLLRLDHGAPLFNLIGPPPALLEPLRQGGWIEPWPAVAGLAALDAQGRLQPAAGEQPLLQGSLWRGRGGMDRIAAGLLALAGEGVELRPGRLVHGLTPPARAGEPWRLEDGDGRALLQADLLLFSGTLLAHPRCCERLGCRVPPLLAAASRLQDPELERAVATIAASGQAPRCCLLLVLPPQAAALWLQLPFRLLTVAAEAAWARGLERLTIQPLADGRCAVVAQGDARLATSQAGEPADRAETALLEALEAALSQVLARLCAAVGTASLACRPAGLLPAAASRRLMRWGAAFPLGPGLPVELSWCPHSRVGFCGDYISGPGFGRIEGAWRSGEALAERLLAAFRASATKG
ncbi:MAG: NAD(P)-binding protein [Synechococcaceae cyanobacterium]|nr:NAD(P)-binding protein [Synechococcaceae cyanobacterium]